MLTGILGQGGGYSEAEKRMVWASAVAIPGFDSAWWARDRFGNVIFYGAYGECSQYGWEIDHVIPSSMGGLGLLGNLAPTHWRANRLKADSFIG